MKITSKHGCSKFGGLVEVESTYWWVVKLFNTQKKKNKTDGCSPIRHQQNTALYFFCEIQKKARVLEVLGEGKGAVLHCLYILRGPS